MPLPLNVIRKKVLCSAEKSSVIWAEPHSRSSAEPNVPSVTNAWCQSECGAKVGVSLLSFLTTISHDMLIFFAHLTPLLPLKNRLVLSAIPFFWNSQKKIVPSYLYLTFYDFRRSDGQSMFKKALLFDSWLFPLREEAEKLAKHNQFDASNKDVYFVNW